MSHKLTGLIIIFAIIASFGLTSLFVNVPTTAAGGATYVGCAGVNQWNADGMPYSAAVDFSGEGAGLLISATGTDVVLLIFINSDYTQYPSQKTTGTIDYTTDGTETKIVFTGYGGSYTSGSCTAPDGASGTYDGVLFRDGRLNADTPNAPAVFVKTDEGIVVYSIDRTGIILDVNAAMLEAYDGTGPIWEGTWVVNGQTLVASFWQLSDGQYQFMIGPDADGDVYVNIFDAMPPTTPKSTNISYNIYGNSPKW